MEGFSLATYARFSPADVALLRRVALDASSWDELPKLADGARSSVARLRLSVGPVVAKRYVDPGLLPLRGLGRRSRAEREANALARLAAILPDNAVRVVGWGVVRRHGLVLRELLLTTELEGAIDLRRVSGLGASERAAAVESVLGQLPRRVAVLHAAGFHAKSLRGKNVLFDPKRGSIALIDLPYARAGDRVTVRRRLRDLALLSLELHRFLDDAQWRRFVREYLWNARDLLPEDAARISVESIGRFAARAAHRTPLSAARRALGRRFRHSHLGARVMGSARDEAPVGGPLSCR